MSGRVGSQRLLPALEHDGLTAMSCPATGSGSAPALRYRRNRCTASRSSRSWCVDSLSTICLIFSYNGDESDGAQDRIRLGSGFPRMNSFDTSTLAISMASSDAVDCISSKAHLRFVLASRPVWAMRTVRDHDSRTHVLATCRVAPGGGMAWHPFSTGASGLLRRAVITTAS